MNIEELKYLLSRLKTDSDLNASPYAISNGISEIIDWLNTQEKEEPYFYKDELYLIFQSVTYLEANIVPSEKKTDLENLKQKVFDVYAKKMREQ